MFKNYLKIAFRSLLKNKVVSLVNISGLAIGTAATLLLLMYVAYEFSYDTHHTKADRIYRLVHHRFIDGALEYQRATVFPEIGLELKKNVGDIETARVFSVSKEYDPVFLIDDTGGKIKKFNEQAVYLADSSIANIFDLEFIHGSRETFLRGANQLAISESTALKFFGSTDVIGRSLHWSGQGEWRVTAVVRDLPANSHFHFSILASWFNAYSERSLLRWDGFYTYVLLKPNTDIKKLHDNIQMFTSRYLAPYNQERNISSEIHLQPLRDIHLHSHLKDEFEANGSYKVVYALLLTSIIILLIALINYINLSTATALDRSREIGIRKAIGSSKKQLVVQFLFEALIVNALALAFSVTLVQLLLPSFNSFLSIDISIRQWSPGEILLFVLAALFVMVLASGYYPAMVLASLNPSRTLTAPKKAGGLRKTLTTFQFGAAIILCITAMVIYYQIEHMRSTELGVNIDDVLVVKSLASPDDEYVNDSSYFRKLDAFKQLVKSNAQVKAVTVSSNGAVNSFFGRMRRKEGGLETQSYLTRVDEEFEDVYDLKLLAGRFFLPQDFSASQNRLVINESAALALGFENPEDAVGTIIPTAGQREIIGVIADYHNLSPRHPIEPSLFAIDFGHMSYISIHFLSSADNIQALITSVRSAWQQAFPEKPFNYNFLNDRFDAQYTSDKRLGTVMSGFTILSLIIACSGLFALALFTTKKKSKEIGLRKVLGATLMDILRLLSLDFLKISLTATIAAVPLGYFIASEWLNNYYTRISLSWGILVLPAIGIISIGLLVIALQALKAASQNPADSLRSDT